MIKSLVSKLNRQTPASIPLMPDKSLSQNVSELAASGLFEADFYAAQVSESQLDWDKAIAHYLEIGAKNLLDPHPLFDTAFYVESNPDVDFNEVNPLLHYLRCGWREGRSPHPLVDVPYYLHKYPDVEELGIDPLSHYIFAGSAERRNPSAFFSAAEYVRNLDLEPSNPLLHFLTSGANDGLLPHPQFNRLFTQRSSREYRDRDHGSVRHFVKFVSINRPQGAKRQLQERSFGISAEVLYTSKLFDEDFVRRQLNEPELSRSDCAIRYLQDWREQELEAHPLFDTQFYLKSNEDIDFEQMNPFVHFLITGWQESRNPHPLFDMAFYLGKNADVRKAQINPLQHFMRSGAHERRNPCRAFNSGYYLKALMALAKDEPANLLLHFLELGASAKILPHPLFELIYKLEQPVAGRVPSRLLTRVEPISQSSPDGKQSLKRIEKLFQIFESELFDQQFYHSQLGRTDLTWLECLNHYFEHWREENIDPHPLFDTSFYIQTNPDVNFNKINPFTHFSLFGWKEDRDPHPLFNLSYYLKSNKDVRRAGMNPVRHFLRFGALERRAFSPFFDSALYEKAFREARFKECFRAYPFAAKKENYARDLLTGECETKWLKQPSNLIVHFLTEGISKGICPSPNLKLFFDFRARTNNFGARYWRVTPRNFKNWDRFTGAHRSFAKRLLESELEEEDLFIMAQLASLLTFRHKCDGFLENERTIFLATHEASRTGAPLLLLQLAKELAARNWECVVIIDRDGVTASEFAEFAHVINFRGAPNKYEDCGRMLRVLFDRLKFDRPKLAILNSMETGHFAKPLVNNGVTIITFVHEVVDTYPLSFLKSVFEMSELVVFPAQFVRNFAREKVNMPNLLDSVIPSALLDDNFGAYSASAARKELRDEIQAPSDSLVVLACGTPDMRKGIDIFLYVARIILNRLTDGPEVHFVWIGAGQIINHSPHYYVDWDIRQAGLKSRIHLLPARKDIRPAFRGADLFILPSRQDPFPCVVHNAMATELPVVAFEDAGGVPEMLTDGGVKLVGYGDVSAFSEAVISYLENKNERIEHGQINARLVRERFQFSEYMAKIESVLSSTLKS